MCIRDSHLSMPQFAWIRWHEAMQSMNGGHKKAAKPSPHTAGTRSKPVSYTHLRAHETSQDPVCRLLLEKKKSTHKSNQNTRQSTHSQTCILHTELTMNYNVRMLLNM